MMQASTYLTFITQFKTEAQVAAVEKALDGMLGRKTLRGEFVESVNKAAFHLHMAFRVKAAQEDEKIGFEDFCQDVEKILEPLSGGQPQQIN